MARVKPRSMEGPEFREPPEKDRKYLAYIGELPCVRTWSYPVEVAHVRFGDPARGKRPTGAGEKPSDRWTVPLSDLMHRNSNEAQHNHGEREWWEEAGIDVIALMLDLQAVFPSVKKAKLVIKHHKEIARIRRTLRDICQKPYVL